MKNNISLIGMPGAGKSVIGKKLSKKISLEFIDLDEYIEKSSGRKISELFKHGEKYFRDIESENLKKVLKNHEDTIISTGGGIILREENIKLLKKNTYIIFIDRDIHHILKTLKLENRPLLRKNPKKSLEKLYNERYKIYYEISDIKVKNNKNIKIIIDKIIEEIGEIWKK